MTKGRSETEIRDHLAQNLALVEPGLMLVKKEKYLPNNEGAAGFIDIFATSASGQLVIIEIKRSDAAARQAIQELTKYAALLKTNKLIKETEYRLLVMSTIWHELLVPFSEFIHATRYDCEGKEIVLGSDGFPVATKRVNPLPPPKTRRFSKRHYIWEFGNGSSANDAVDKIAKHMHKIGLDDFIVAVVTTTAQVEGISHIAYFAQQELSLDEYMTLIEKRFSKDEISDFQDC